MLPIQIMNLSNIHSDLIQNENIVCNQFMFYIIIMILNIFWSW